MQYTKQNPTTVRSLFANIAKRYDLGNSILSFGLHKWWNRRLVKETLKHHPKNYLDLCAGTGEIAATYLKTNPSLEKLVLLDFCPEMLEIAKERIDKKYRPIFTVADAQQIPFDDQSFDAITIAYGLRNIKDPFKALLEMRRVLKKGGSLGILELTKPYNPLMRVGHLIHLKTAVPILGKLLTSDKQAYHYLSQSIQTFIEPKTIETFLLDAGFTQIQTLPLNLGIATLFVARAS